MGVSGIHFPPAVAGMQAAVYFLSLGPEENFGQHVHPPYLLAETAWERILTHFAALTGLLHKSKDLIPVEHIFVNQAVAITGLKKLA